MPIFEWRSIMPASADEVFAYHARPGAFRRLAPPWQRLKVLEESGDVTSGRVVFDVWLGPVRRHWVAEMGSAMPGRQFVDRQLEGPFASWEHVHRFVPVDEGKSELLDHVEYHLPAGGLTDSVGAGPGRQDALARSSAFATSARGWTSGGTRSGPTSRASRWPSPGRAA